MNFEQSEVVSIGADAVGDDEHCEDCTSVSYAALMEGAAGSFADRGTHLKSHGWRHLRDRAGMVKLCDACALALAGKEQTP